MYQYLETFGWMTVFLSVKKKRQCKVAVGFETEDVVRIVHMTHFSQLGTEGLDCKNKGEKNKITWHFFSASRGTLYAYV